MVQKERFEIMTEKFGKDKARRNQEEIRKSIREMTDFLKTEEGVTREGVNPYFGKIIKRMEEVSK